MRYVLFVCTHNAGRSQIAQAFLERYAPDDIRAESAGEEPATEIWPNVIEAMREVGIDISHRRPKKLDLEMQLHADWAITLHCKASCPFVPSQVDDWEVDDPAGEPLERVREIRDEIEQRVEEFVETRLDDIRADRTAHELRLEKLIPSLVEEFADEKPAEEIRACADVVLAEFADVPVRSFVLTLARRRARECLRDGSCASLVAPV
jgi:arsenate reductase (thioredoxin)